MAWRLPAPKALRTWQRAIWMEELALICFLHKGSPSLLLRFFFCNDSWIGLLYASMPLKQRVAAIWEAVHSILLLGVAGAFFIWEIMEKVWRGPELHLVTFIANAIALLAVVVGLERFLRFGHLEKQLSGVLSEVAVVRGALSQSTERLEHLISSLGPCRFEKGFENIYAEAAKLVPFANRSIKTLIVGASTPAPASFAEAVSEHLKRSSSVSYEAVLCVDFASFNEEFWSRNRERRDYYKKADVLKRVVLRALNTKRPIGFDVLVIDNRHACLAFSPVAGTSSKREACIIFEDQPEIAQHLADWIEKAKAESVDFIDAEQKWYKEHDRGTKSTAGKST